MCPSCAEMVFGVSLAKWTDFNTRFHHSVLAPRFVHRRMNLFPAMRQMHLMTVNLMSHLTWAKNAQIIGQTFFFFFFSVSVRVF